jgi:myo-inositol 2-dehydrogenase/D-chiro-inositol 1-dehydrogenase
MTVLRNDNQVLGVGFIGAGPVVQAIHLPTLARLQERFSVVHVMDIDLELAERVADPWAAQASTDIGPLLANPAVDVVAICSPHGFHASQAIAACRAGKRAVLIEKPFATTVDEAEQVARVAQETGTPIFVGAMHQFDPGWTSASEERLALQASAHTIRSSIVLPANALFERYAAEVPQRQQPPSSSAEEDEEPDVGAGIRGALLGLAIHDLPLIREFVPQGAAIRVLSAQTLAPWGYLVILDVSGLLVELHAQMPVLATPTWTLEVISADRALRSTFTPSYVQAGSSTSTIRSGNTAKRFGPFRANGYEGEWQALYDAVTAGKQAPELADLLGDLRFAISIADATARFLSATKESETAA